MEPGSTRDRKTQIHLQVPDPLKKPNALRELSVDVQYYASEDDEDRVDSQNPFLRTRTSQSNIEISLSRRMVCPVVSLRS